MSSRLRNHKGSFIKWSSCALSTWTHSGLKPPSFLFTHHHPSIPNLFTVVMSATAPTTVDPQGNSRAESGHGSKAQPTRVMVITYPHTFEYSRTVDAFARMTQTEMEAIQQFLNQVTDIRLKRYNDPKQAELFDKEQHIREARKRRNELRMDELTALLKKSKQSEGLKKEISILSDQMRWDKDFEKENGFMSKQRSSKESSTTKSGINLLEQYLAISQERDEEDVQYIFQNSQMVQGFDPQTLRDVCCMIDDDDSMLDEDTQMDAFSAINRLCRGAHSWDWFRLPTNKETELAAHGAREQGVINPHVSDNDGAPIDGSTDRPSWAGIDKFVSIYNP